MLTFRAYVSLDVFLVNVAEAFWFSANVLTVIEEITGVVPGEPALP